MYIYRRYSTSWIDIISSFITLFLTIGILCLINIFPMTIYEKFIYQQATPICAEEIERSWHNGWIVDSSQHSRICTGYPADDDVNTIQSIEEWENINFRPIYFEVSIQDLIPTGIYREIMRYGNMYTGESTRKKYEPFFTENKLLTIFSEGIARYGQFYIMRLESNEKIVVLIDDRLIDTKKDRIILPLGCYNDKSLGLKEYLGSQETMISQFGISETLADGFVDTVFGWKKGTEYTKFYNHSQTLKVIAIFILFPLCGFFVTKIFSKLNFYSKKNHKKRKKQP